MCGICGVWGFEGRDLVRRMTKLITHRGPDGSGTFFDKNIGLGMRRLSIIDVKGGSQPISSEDGDITVVYNGEIYNHIGIRYELEKRGHKFSTKADTEVLVHAYEEYGPSFIKRLNGCFAFALWDGRKRQLMLARDRLGIKPLYIAKAKDGIIFASEIKSILLDRGIKRRVNWHTLEKFLTFRYISGPDTLFQGIEKVLPGTYLLLDRQKKTVRYWKPEISEGNQTESYYTQKLLRMFEDAVERRLMSDVPLGAFLSGGLDSSAIVGLMSRMKEDTLKTFSVGFGSEDVDELQHAKLVSEFFGTDHHEFIVESERIKDLPAVLWHMDEPVADPSAIPIYLLSGLARKHVTVVESGEGADELYAGYMQHKAILKSERFISGASKVASAGVGALPVKLLDMWFEYPGSMGEKGKQRLRKFMSTGRRGERYLSLISAFGTEERRSVLTAADRSIEDATEKQLAGGDFFSKVLLFEQNNWLPTYMLEKTDKMTMARSLELRVPFLDHELVEFSNTIPSSLKIRGGTSKYILRKAVANLLPPQIVKRKKHPYYTPIDQWFEENLNEIGMQLLDDSVLRRKGFFKPAAVRKIFTEHNSSKLLCSRQLWCLICFELWHRMYIESDMKKPPKLETLL